MTPALSVARTRGWSAALGHHGWLRDGASNIPNAHGAIFFAIRRMPFDVSQTVQIFSCVEKGIGPDCPTPPQQSWPY
jgi:hypothetical protein